MAMIKCPECGNMVSDKAQSCIHCGAPLVEEKNIVKIRTPKMNDIFLKNFNFIFTDDKTGKQLASVNQNEVATFELDTATTIRCHLKQGGNKDAIMQYTPGGLKRYTITFGSTMFRGYLKFTEVDVFDSYN